MKLFIFCIFCVLYSISFGQKTDNNHLSKMSNRYELEYRSKYSFAINHGVFSILAMSVVQDTVFKSSYDIKSDTIIINNGNCKLKLKVKSSGILLAISDFYLYVKKDDKLYATILQIGEKVFLLGGGWKNDLKEGKWIFLDENEISSNVIFKAGVIVGVW